MKVYNKLVRDNIPNIMIQNNAIPKTRILNDDEYYEELKKKLNEEVKEFCESDEVEEIADIEEVLLALLEYKNVSKEKLEEIRTQKVLKRGAFKNKIFLESEK